MGKTLIHVDCVDQRLFVSSTPIIASGGRNEDEIEFNFCPLWDGFEKTAVFYRDKSAVYHAIVSENRCIIPHEVLADEGWIYFGVFGVKDDITRTSEIMKYHIIKGAITAGTNPSDPTPDIYSQYIKRINDLENFTPRPFEATGNPVTLETFEGMPLDVVTVFEPKQAGSGDPYPAGGGKNLANLTFSSSELVIVRNGDGTITATNNTDSDISGPKCELTGVLPAGTYIISKNDTPNDVYLQMSSSDYSNNITTYTFDYDGVSYLRILCSNVKGGSSVTYKIQLERGSTATEYAPSSNIRPFIGYDKLGLNHAGKNLLKYREDISANSAVKKLLEDGKVVIKAALPSSWYRFGEFNIIKGKTYAISGVLEYGRIGLSITSVGLPADGTIPNISLARGAASDILHAGLSENVFVANESVTVYLWYCSDVGNTGSNPTFTMALQVELGSVVAAYEPYKGELHTLQIGQTVYGGTVDWNAGKMTVEWECKRMADWTWRVSTSTQGRFMYDQSGIIPDVAPLCSIMRGKTGLDTERNTVYNNYAQIVVQTDFSTREEYVAWLDENDAHIAYKLAEPVEIQFEPHHINALNGTNILYGDGVLDVKWRTDILWLTSSLIKRVAELESSIATLETTAATN